MAERKTNVYITVHLNEETILWLGRNDRIPSDQARLDLELLRKLLEISEGESGKLPLAKALKKAETLILSRNNPIQEEPRHR